MGFCKFCGKELDSEGRCTCAEFEEENSVKREKIKADGMTKGKAKKFFKFLGIVALIALVIFIVDSIISAAAAYKSPVEKLTKGIRKGDTQLLMEAMYTDNEIAEMRVRVKDRNMTWDDFVKQNDKEIKENLDLDGISRLKCDVTAKEKISGSNIDSIRNFYDKQFSENVTKAYRVEVKFTMRDQGEKVEQSGWLCVVKLKKGGWKYCPEFSNDSFSFITNSITKLKV